MHKNFRFALSLLATVILLASCGKKAPKEAKYIPKDAAYTIVVDAKSLQEKLKKGNLGIDSILAKIQSMGDTMSAKDKQAWEDFKNSGLNQEGNLTVFIQQKGSMKSGQTFVVNAMLQLTDQAKLEAFFQKSELFKEKPITKENGYSYIRMDVNSMVSWNGDVAIATFYNKQPKIEYDSLGNYKPTDMSGVEADMKKQVSIYYTQKESESMASVEYFKGMFKEKADGYVFTTSAGTLAALNAMPFNLPKLEELLKDNYGVATFNFEDGKVVLKGQSFTNPLLSSILKKYKGSTVNISAIEKFPSQNVNGVMLMAFNPELLDGIVKELEVGGLIDGVLSTQGIARADIFKALKGEINLAVGDFTVSNKTKTIIGYDGKPFESTSEQPDAKMILSAAIGDKAAFTKLMDKAVEVGGGAVVKTVTGYAFGPMMQSTGFFLHTDDKYIIIARDSATYAAYAAGNTKAKIDGDVIDKLKGKSMSGYVNINSIINGALPSMKDALGAKAMTIVNTTFKDGHFSAENFDGKSVKSEAQLNMVDTKQNSLVSIINMALNIATTIKAEDKKMKEMYNSQQDSVIMVPPVVAP